MTKRAKIDKIRLRDLSVKRIQDNEKILKKMSTINCLPIADDDIKKGFDCTFDGSLIGSGNLTLTQVENGDSDFYVDNVWTNGELIMALLLTLIFIWLVFSWLFKFVFPDNKIKITKRDA